MFLTYNTIMFSIVCFVSLAIITAVISVYAYVVNKTNKSGFVTKKDIRFFENRVDRDINHINKKIALINEFLLDGERNRLLMKDVDNLMDSTVKEIVDSTEGSQS